MYHIISCSHNNYTHALAHARTYTYMYIYAQLLLFVSPLSFFFLFLGGCSSMVFVQFHYYPLCLPPPRLFAFCYVKVPDDIPRQENGCDCGVFTLQVQLLYLMDPLFPLFFLFFFLPTSSMLLGAVSINRTRLTLLLYLSLLFFYSLPTI